MIISVTPNRLLKTQIFEKKSLFPAKKFPAHSFLYYRLGQTSRNNLKGSTMYSGSYWARYKIISLGPTRSFEKISQKKYIFPMKNKFGQFFCRITEYGRPQVTCYQASQGIMVVIEQFI